MNKLNRSSCIITEVTRKNILGKTKAQSPERYMKRLGYKSLGYSDVDLSRLLKDDIFVCKMHVGKYECTVAYKGVLERLADTLQNQPRPNVTLQSVIRSMSQSFVNPDILVDCTCPDFKYRFAYWATKFGYKYGKPETRPTKITNPGDNHGAVCKHLASILSNKSWLIKAASILNNYIKSYPDKVREALGLSEDELIVNPYINQYTMRKSEPEESPDESEDTLEIDTDEVETDSTDETQDDSEDEEDEDGSTDRS